MEDIKYILVWSLTDNSKNTGPKWSHNCFGQKWDPFNKSHTAQYQLALIESVIEYEMKKDTTMWSLEQREVPICPGNATKSLNVRHKDSREVIQ